MHKVRITELLDGTLEINEIDVEWGRRLGFIRRAITSYDKYDLDNIIRMIYKNVAWDIVAVLKIDDTRVPELLLKAINNVILINYPIKICFRLDRDVKYMRESFDTLYDLTVRYIFSNIGYKKNIQKTEVLL